MNSGQVILHHYPQSPVAEKVRVVLGMKGLTWKSVLIPRLPPKPNLMPLTGGYRLTPVMQVGADIYCDSTCIIQELERRFPQPTLFPGGIKSMTLGGVSWSDDLLFKDVITVALVEMSPNMPPEFLADRGPLYFGSDFSLDVLKANYAQCLAKIGTQFSEMDKRLKSGDFMLGDLPGLPDALAYYLVWFLRDRMAQGDPFFAPFENLRAWEQRVKDIGHGRQEEMGDLEALDIAKRAEPQTPEHASPGDPLDLNVGDKILIQPITGGPQVLGFLHSLSDDLVAILREDEQVGQVCVHFPRQGYRVERVEPSAA